MDQATTSTAGMYINGAWTGARSGKRFVVRNPATLEPLAEVGDGGREETRAAIEAAHAAFPAWAGTPAPERAALLQRTARLITEHRDALAVTLTQENGKPLAQARAEVDGMAELCVWFAEEARRISGRILPPETPTRRILTLRQPVGVVAAITPFNFPGNLLARKLAPALAAGCTVVVRPARVTPLIAVSLFKILAGAGAPPGVANLVTGTDSAGIGEELATHPLVRKVTFTGSTDIGKVLLAKAAGTVKRVSMELGGHAPFLVFQDADLDKAAAAAALSGFRNCGQVCTSTNRVLVQQQVAAAFTERLAALTRPLRLGNGLEPGVEVGPLIDKAGFDKVVAHVEDARAKGATVLVGGRPATPDGLAGYFYEPTLLTGVNLDMRVMHEETFGPVLPVMAFETEEEALRIANDTPYGLAAYFFTRDVGRVFRVAERLEYGIVGANDPRPVGTHFPFGGMKESGLGRENGTEGIEAFLEVKSVVIGL